MAITVAKGGFSVKRESRTLSASASAEPSTGHERNARVSDPLAIAVAPVGAVSLGTLGAGAGDVSWRGVLRSAVHGPGDVSWVGGEGGQGLSGWYKEGDSNGEEFHAELFA